MKKLSVIVLFLISFIFIGCGNKGADNLNDKEKDMIINHMWPVTLYLPKSIEGIILTFVDKYSAMSESFEVMKSRLFMKKTFRYTYAILSLMIIKF